MSLRAPSAANNDTNDIRYLECGGLRPLYGLSRITQTTFVAIFLLSAFYKGESQEKNFPGDWKEQRFLPGSPAHVMLGGSWGSLFSQIHVAVVTTSSVSDATSSAVAIKMPTIVLSEARGL
jgi:hypothetical protein